MPLPKGWLDFSNVGEQLYDDPPLIACKVPLSEKYRPPTDRRFTPTIAMELMPKLGLIIDLTDTYAYYDPQEFTVTGVSYEKIRVPGHVLPPENLVQRFFNVIDRFVEEKGSSDNNLIAVHCTHGLNRTGLFVCRYLIQRLGVPSEDAIKLFEKARGYTMQRPLYVQYLRNCEPKNKITKRPENHHGGERYTSSNESSGSHWRNEKGHSDATFSSGRDSRYFEEGLEGYRRSEISKRPENRHGGERYSSSNESSGSNWRNRKGHSDVTLSSGCDSRNFEEDLECYRRSVISKRPENRHGGERYSSSNEPSGSHWRNKKWHSDATFSSGRDSRNFEEDLGGYRRSEISKRLENRHGGERYSSSNESSGYNSQRRNCYGLEHHQKSSFPQQPANNQRFDNNSQIVKTLHSLEFTSPLDNFYED